MQPSQPTRFGSTLARPACLLVLATVALGIVACGGSSSSQSTASSGSSGTSQNTARVRLTDCLRKQGVNVPNNRGQNGGGAPPANFDRQKLQAALQGPCKKYQQGAFGNLSRQDQSRFRDQLTKFTSCMRKHGVNIPDVQPGQGPPANVNQNDPKVQTAAKACRAQLPRGGPGGPAQ